MTFATGTPFLPLRAPLFVPATRPERFRKAASSGADAIVVDLEDAVPPVDKVGARDGLAVLSEIATPAYVRINAIWTPWFDDDLFSVKQNGLQLICVPKVESLDVLDAVTNAIGSNVSILAQIETAAGLLNATAIAGHHAVRQLAFGPADYFFDLGCAPSPQLVAHALNHLAVASRACAIALPLDGPCFSIGDAAAIHDECVSAKANGASGKLCIHPSQIAPVIQAFSPSENDIAWAKRVIAADRNGEAQIVDGRMIDAPIVARARTVLNQSERMAR